MDTPQVDDLIMSGGALAAALVAIIGFIAIVQRALMRWLEKAVGELREDLTDIRKEVHPNHGSSLRDAVNNISDRQVELIDEIKDQRLRLRTHIDWHMDNK